MIRFLNNFSALLVEAISPTDTLLVIDQDMPVLTPGDYFLLTLYERVGAQEHSWEIIRVTSTGMMGGNTLTVMRGQENTIPRTFTAGTRVEMRLTAGSALTVADNTISSEKTWSSRKINQKLSAISITQAYISTEGRLMLNFGATTDKPSITTEGISVTENEPITVSHNLGTEAVTVRVEEAATGAEIWVDWGVVDRNSITVGPFYEDTAVVITVTADTV